MSDRRRRQTLVYYALVPAIVLAVLVLGAIALRTTLQIEKARQQTVFDATLTLAGERVDRLDRQIIAQDNVVSAHVDLTDLSSLSRRWIPTSGRETPTVRAILVLDMDHAEHEVLAFASRAPGPEDDSFRRLLIARLLPQLNMQGAVDELRHLHVVADEQSVLLSYWQRQDHGRRFLVVAWHDVRRAVHDLVPRLYRDVERSNSRMNIIDEQGRIVFGPPIQVGEFTVGLPFPTTFYNWRLQVALASAEQLGQKVERQRFVEIIMVCISGVIALAGVAIVVAASIKEQRLLALKSDFVANVSHELKTPLSLIRMFSELLLENRLQNDAKRKQYLEIISKESVRLTGLIENVLDFAKVERGKAAYEFVEINLAETVSRAADIYRYRAEREGVELTVVVPEGPCLCLADPRAVELAVINLLDNALKYAGEGRRVDIRVEPRGRWIHVCVRDHGPGIESGDQKRIFERFVRGRTVGKNHVRGSGIGLSLVKHIAESHGGHVDVQSPVENARGAEFILRFPGA